MDALDMLIKDEVPLAIETTQGTHSRLHYFEGSLDRGTVLHALNSIRRSATFEEAVGLAFLASPDRGENGWRPLSALDPRF